MTEEDKQEEDEEEDDYFAEIQLSKSKKYNFNYLPFNTKNTFTKEDFDILCVLGKGAYARVVKAKYKKNDEIVAIKVIDKAFIEKENKVYQVYLENELLGRLHHKNIIKIIGIFDDPNKINIVLEYCSNGDFSDYIIKNCNLY